MDPTVSSIWNARVASKTGTLHTFDAATFTWNKDVPAGGTVTFGFIGNPGLARKAPTEFAFTAQGTTPTPTRRGSVVYESLPDSATVGGDSYAPQPAASRPPPGNGAGLPSADQLAATGIPALNLDLHVYATVPAQRLVFINARKYREGETLQEGPVVSEITPTGVVLEYQGRSYLLTHD